MPAKTSKLSKHEKLGISFVEFGALLAVRELIRGGYVHHVRKAPRELWDDVAEKAGSCHLINMAVPGTTNDHCGAIGCIGGTMAMIMGRDADEYVRKTDEGPLHELFYPPQDGYYRNEPSYNDITPIQMLMAIDNFLARGKANWPKVLGLKKKVWR